MSDEYLRIRIVADGKQANRELAGVEGSLERMRGALARIGHYGAAAFSGWQLSGAGAALLKLSEEVKLVDARLKLVAKSSQEFAAAQRLAYDVARQTGAGYGAVATLYTRLLQAGRDYGLTAERIGTVTRATAQALKISGASAAESAGVIRQFSQALGSGVLRGDEFNSIMENGGRLAKALADGLGLPIGQLRALAEQGLLTTDVIARALESQAKALAEELPKIPKTMAEAFANLRDEAGRAMLVVDESFGLSRSGIAALNTVAENATGVLKGLALVLTGAVTVALARAGNAAAEYAVKKGAAIAADIRATQVSIEHARWRVYYAQQELVAAQAAVASATGMARLAAVENTLIPAKQRLAAAQTALNATMEQGAVVSRGLGAALGFVGGPLGLILTALTLGATAWTLWGDNAESAMARAKRRAEETRDELARIRDALKFGEDRLAPFRQAVAEAQAEVAAASRPVRRKVGRSQVLSAPYVDEDRLAEARDRLAVATRKLTEAEKGLKALEEKRATPTAEGLALLARGFDRYVDQYRAKLDPLKAALKQLREEAEKARIPLDSPKFKEAEALLRASFRKKDGSSPTRDTLAGILAQTDIARLAEYNRLMAELVRRRKELGEEQYAQAVSVLLERTFGDKVRDNAREMAEDARFMAEVERSAWAVGQENLRWRQEAAQADAERLAKGEAIVDAIRRETIETGMTNEARQLAADLLALEASGIDRASDAYARLREEIVRANAERAQAQALDAAAKARAEDLAQTWRNLAQGIQSAIAGALVNMEGGFRGFARSIVDMFRNTVAQSIAKSLTDSIMVGLKGGGGIFGAVRSGLSLFGLSFATGGYTGPGGRYEPAGVVHRGEYVFSAPAVTRIGVATLEAIHRFAAGVATPTLPRLGYADGGLVSGRVARDDAPTAVHVSVNISTPDAASFRRSGGQIGAMIADAVGRGMRYK